MIQAAVFGMLGANAELKTSKTGKPYLRMNVRTGDGDAAVWISALVFDAEAIEQAAHFVKASAVYLEGRLTPTSWTGDDGTVRHGLSLMASHCRLPAIGRHRPRKERKPKPDRVETLKAAAGAAIPFNDEIGF